MNYLKEAQNTLDELKEYRHNFHRKPEIGFDLPETVDYVVEKLKSFGYKPEILEPSGVTATVGPKGKVVLLRADMDALPIKEESGEEFSSENDYMHACGHDLHTAVLLGVAKLLKEHEDELEGTVKFLFQPAEELLVGGEAMVEAGILENPHVDVACGFHVIPTLKEGIYTSTGPVMASANNFKIHIQGRGSHGAMPFQGIDPVTIGSHIIVSAQEIIARELPITEPVILTMGRFMANGAMNVVADSAEIEGTLRSFSSEGQKIAKKRLVEIVESTAKSLRGEASVEFLSDVPVLETDEALTVALRRYIHEMDPNIPLYGRDTMTATEDFAHITSRVPSAHFYIGAQHPDLETPYNAHHPKVRFDEDQMPLAVAGLCQFASRWLADQAN